MQDVADAPKVLLPRSSDSDTFLGPDNRDVVTKHLSQYQQSADALAQHWTSRSRDFQLRPSTVARAASRVWENFQYVHPAEARCFLVDLIEHCVARHARQASGREFPLSGALETYLQKQPVNQRERARLQVALRQGSLIGLE